MPPETFKHWSTHEEGVVSVQGWFECDDGRIFTAPPIHTPSVRYSTTRGQPRRIGTWPTGSLDGARDGCFTVFLFGDFLALVWFIYISPTGYSPIDR